MKLLLPHAGCVLTFGCGIGRAVPHVGFPIRRGRERLTSFPLEVVDTAGWKPALPDAPTLPPKNLRRM